jgi:hypothetical protein
LHYGHTYLHKFQSSSGKQKDLKGLTVGEDVVEGHNDFKKFGFDFPKKDKNDPANQTTIDKDGEIFDDIETSEEAINLAVSIMSESKDLPAVLETPQKLWWRDSKRNWHFIQDVDISFVVGRKPGRRGKLVAITTDRGLSHEQKYTGPSPKP